MPEASADSECLACRGEVRVLEEQLRRRSEFSRSFAERNDRSFTSALGVLPLLDWGENRLRSLYAVSNHTCGCGRAVSFPTVLFTVQGRPLPLLDVANYGVQLRLHLHLLVPGSPMSWTAFTPFSGVFPLFGALRRYWGRFVWIRGQLVMMGYPARSQRHPHITHSMSLYIRSRIRGILRYAPLEVVGSL